MSIKIITDSTSDYLKSYADERDIEIAHLKVIIDNEEYIDGVNLSKKEFYEKMRAAKEVPKTSQVTPAQFTQMFENALEKHDQVIGIFLSSSLSGTYQSAVIAKEALNNENIFVVDSNQTTFAMQMLVDIAADMRDEGKDAKEIVDKLNEIKGKIKLYAMIDDLKNLKKSGRLSTAGLVIGTALHIKPVITVIDGTAHIAEKVKGKK
ncbi:MAG: DegV family protein, partial [Oscillospiraceae bacterium]